MSGYLAYLFISTFLPQYRHFELYVHEGVTAVIILIAGMLITGSTIKLIEFRLRKSRKDLFGISLIIRIVFYIIVLALVLSAFHISITGILAGSAIGGIVLGLAIQTVASNLVASLFVTSTGTIKYGEVVGINSWEWSIDTTGKIVDIKTLFSKMMTKDNTVIHIPNSALLGNSVMTEYRIDQDRYLYPVNATTNADVPADLIMQRFVSKCNDKSYSIYLMSKAGSTNNYLILINFKEVDELNKKISEANLLLDRCYWEARSYINSIGSNALLENNIDYQKFPVSVTLNSDIPPSEIIDYAEKNFADGRIKVLLSAKGSGTNTYTMLVETEHPEGVDELTSRVNIFMEHVYNKLKEEKTVTPFGNSGKVDVAKKYIGKRVYVIVLRE